METFEVYFDGYVHQDEDKKFINLVGPKQKIIKSFGNSFYHHLLDDISEVILAMDKYPKAQLILDISDILDRMHHDSWDSFSFFLKCLDKKRVDYKLVAIKHFDAVYINNFAILSFPWRTGFQAQSVYEFFKEFISDEGIEPTRNVFVSRKMVTPRLFDNENIEKFMVSNDLRIDSHIRLENMFSEMGFEIVYPENFTKFEDQVRFFYSVKTIASLTSSGLTNALFMKPGGTMIEVSTPLLTPVITFDDSEYMDKNGQEFALELHNFYTNLAFLKNLLYIAIPNIDQTVKTLIGQVSKFEKLKTFLDRNE